MVRFLRFFILTASRVELKYMNDRGMRGIAGLSFKTALQFIRKGKLDLSGYTVHLSSESTSCVGTVEEFVDSGYQLQLKVIKYRPLSFEAEAQLGVHRRVPHDIPDVTLVSSSGRVSETAAVTYGFDDTTTDGAHDSDETDEADEVENIVVNNRVYYKEQHLMPFVDAMVISILPWRRRIVMNLPNGLISLGRRNLYMRLLNRELRPYLSNPVNKLTMRIRGQRVMPSCSQLKAAGRVDLVKLIQKAGGVCEVCYGINGLIVWNGIYRSDAQGQ